MYTLIWISLFPGHKVSLIIQYEESVIGRFSSDICVISKVVLICCEIA
jgi:hypothetical protein